MPPVTPFHRGHTLTPLFTGKQTSQLQRPPRLLALEVPDDGSASGSGSSGYASEDRTIHVQQFCWANEERPDPAKDAASSQNHDKRSGSGRALLEQHVTPAIAMQLPAEQKNSLYEAWLWLVTKYDKEPEHEKRTLRRKLARLHFREGRANEFLTKFELLRAKYRCLGGVLPENEAIEMVLNRLPASWSLFVTVIDNLPSQDKTWESFVLHEERIKAIKPTNRSASTTQERRQRRKKGEEERKRKCCWKCGKAGHLQRDCQ